MHIKYSPVNTEDKDTVVEYIDENTIKIDDEMYEFSLADVVWTEVDEQTGYAILEAKRVDGELFLTVRRYYTDIKRPIWDTGDYHDITG